jgi:hypothetical protein
MKTNIFTVTCGHKKQTPWSESASELFITKFVGMKTMTYISLGVIHTNNNLRLREEHLTLLLCWNSLPDHHLDPVAAPPTLLITNTNCV